MHTSVTLQNKLFANVHVSADAKESPLARKELICCHSIIGPAILVEMPFKD